MNFYKCVFVCMCVCVCVCVFMQKLFGEFSHSIRDMDPISKIYMIRNVSSGLKKIQLKLYSLMRYVKMFSVMLLLFIKTAIHDVTFSSLIIWFCQSVGISKLLFIKSHSGCNVLYIFSSTQRMILLDKVVYGWALLLICLLWPKQFIVLINILLKSRACM